MVATALGVLIGRTIRLRDRQAPEAPPDRKPAAGPWIPTQNSGERSRRRGK